LLGGLISSTAATVSYARRTHNAREVVSLSLLVIVIASTMAMIRVLAEISIVAPKSFRALGPPLAAMLAWMLLIVCVIYPFHRRSKSSLPDTQNPAELRPALVFGGLYAVVIFAVAAAKDYFGATGLYGIALLSGLHDMDAITLSTARLVDQNQLDASIGWRLILTAFLSNLLAKAGIVLALGHRALLGRILIAFGVAFLAGLALLFAWPAS
jgi:uncharacterized membrane protein (DUF4010 family)